MSGELKQESVELWSVERVQQWMRGHGKAYEQYTQNIEDHHIDGHALIHGLASAASWSEAGVSNTLHRTVLVKKRSELLDASTPLAPPIQAAAAAAEPSTIDGVEILLESTEPINAADIRLVRRFGEGNFGEAWLASYSGADVVVKCLKAAQSPDNEKARIAMQEFVREVKILMGCRHPNVIRYLGVARHDRELR